MDAIVLRGANYLRFTNSDPYAPTFLKPRPIRQYFHAAHTSIYELRRRSISQKGFKVCRPSLSVICHLSSVVRRPYLLSSHVSTLVHCISNFTLCSIHQYFLLYVHQFLLYIINYYVQFTVFFTDRVFTVHYFVNTVQVLFTDYYALHI